jgi:hypothetical protein
MKMQAKRGWKKKISPATVARDAAGKFQKGVSGNPGGRPTAAIEVRELAREHGPEAIARLLMWMRGGDAQSSIAAAKILLDRGYGKSIQHVAGNVSGGALVNLNFNGTTVTTPEEAQRVYEMISRDSSIDTSQIKFLPAKKSETPK